MKQSIKKIIAILLTLVISMVTMTGYSYASGKSSKLTKGHVIVINTKKNKLGYFKNGNLVKEFSVATGKSSTPTPTGKTVIVNKIKNRPYYSGGIPGGSPKNPLGDRWLGLNVKGTFGTTYAIHGNNNSSSIGKSVSAGCVRMHNSEIRWLYNQVKVGTIVIIEKSDKTFSKIAANYNVILNEKTKNMKNVEDKYKQFYIYGPQSNPTLNLSNKNSLITKSSQATNILTKTKGEKKYDRQKFLDAWNKLSKSEKKQQSMTKINFEYKKIISIVQAAQADLKFYENVKSNANTLINNKKKAINLNSKKNMKLGARGKAYKEYIEATKYGENSSNSPRMKYINQKYVDSVKFLNVAAQLGNNNLSKAKTEASKIKDSTLKKISNKAISDKKKKQVISKYNEFVKYDDTDKPSIDLENKNELIKKSSSATNILKKSKDGKKYDRQKFLDAWNNLSSSEKKDSKMKSIYTQYKNIVSVVEAAEANLKFYENVKNNAQTLINDVVESNKLNSKKNMKLGARGKAYKEYKEATKTGETTKNSSRIKYINEKYLDAVRFLNISKYLNENNINKVNIELGKLKDKTLKNIVVYNLK